MPGWRMQGHPVDKRTTDRDYCERMDRVMLVSGLNRRTLEKKWPSFERAFANCEVNEVAGFQEPGIEVGEDVSEDMKEWEARHHDA